MNIFLLIHLVIATQLTVVDTTGAPIPSVTVNSTLTHNARTDSLGHVMVDFCTNDRVTLCRIGYQIKVVIAPPEDGRIVLQRNSLPIPGMRVTGRNDRRVIEIPPGATVSVAEVLQSQVDVFTSDAQPGRPQEVTLQGGLARHVQVRLDGVVLNRSGRPFDLSTIPAESIEKIEVIAGPSPGAAGMDGVILLWSREDVEHSKEAAYTFGSFGLWELQNELHVGNDDISVGLLHTHEESDGDFPYIDPYTDEPSHRGNNASRSDVARMQLRWRRGVPFRFEWRRQCRKRGLPGPIYQQTQHDAATMAERLDHAVFELGDDHLKLRALHDDDRTHYSNIGSTSPTTFSDGVTYSQLSEVALSSAHQAGDFSFRLLADIRHETFRYDDQRNPFGDIDEVWRDNLGCEGEASHRIGAGDWLFSAAATLRGDWEQARLDRAQASGRIDLAADWSTAVPLRFELAAGRSFTPPSFYDLHWRGDSQAAGNPNLMPETSKGLQCGVEASDDAWSLAFETAWRLYDGLIYWMRSPTGWKPHNLNAAEKRVHTLSGEWRPMSFIELGASWQRVFAWNRSLTDDGEHGDHWGKNISYTPSSQTQARLALTPADWRLEASWRRTGRRWTTNDNLYPALPAYNLLDASVSWSPRWLGVDWRLAVESDNLLDRRYAVYDSDPMPGRSWRASVSVHTAL